MTSALPRSERMPLPDNATQPPTRARWRAWLAAHHGRSKGVWLVLWKRGSGQAAWGYEAAVEEALCFGWIDSKPRVLDAERSMRWFAPRKPGTGWSRINKARIERAVAEGRMAAAGAAKIAAAMADGSWAKLDAVEDLLVPPDLAQALAEQGSAATLNFTAFPRSVKRSILEWIGNAKRRETREQRIRETATLAARNERANQWRTTRTRDPAA